jgi:hypothetical protein
VHPSPETSTGRCLLAGAARAFLCRCPDEAIPAAAAFVRTLVGDGWVVIVESNRVAPWLDADVCLFVASPAIADWKASVAALASRTDAVVLAHGSWAMPAAAWVRAGGALDRPTFRFTADWTVPGLGPWLAQSGLLDTPHGSTPGSYGAPEVSVGRVLPSWLAPRTRHAGCPGSHPCKSNALC